MTSLDLTHEVFSRRGAWWSLGHLGAWQERPAGLFLRTHRTNLVSHDLIHIEVVDERKTPISPRYHAEPTLLRLETDAGSVEIFMPTARRLRARGTGVGLRLTSWRIWYSGLVQLEPQSWELRMGNRQARYTFTVPQGSAQASLVNTPNSDMDRLQTFALEVHPVESSWELVIDDTPAVGIPPRDLRGWDEDRSSIEAEWQDWLERAAPSPDAYAKTRERAAYVNWCSVVEPYGLVRRPAMLMSKNWMDKVWSWDNCFNAMASILQDPKLGWDQFAFFFDHQEEHGAFPDMIRDAELSYGHSKPPIYGWALQWMLRNGAELSAEQLAEAYRALEKQADFWMRYRDSDNDGIPGYHHGCDSGWDNGTLFDHGGEVESPDLSAHLILQMDCLSDLADRLGRRAESQQWSTRATALLEALLKHSWRGDHFAAPRSGDHALAPAGDCLLNYVPIVLGERLPVPIFQSLAAGLSEPVRFLTDWGLATESLRSPLYTDDGYWRGPIWAPSTMLIVDGLYRGGATELAADIARRFCRLCQMSGFAENFDARTGAPLRDKAYTWTSSVFLILASRYVG